MIDRDKQSMCLALENEQKCNDECRLRKDCILDTYMFSPLYNQDTVVF